MKSTFVSMLPAWFIADQYRKSKIPLSKKEGLSYVPPCHDFLCIEYGGTPCISYSSRSYLYLFQHEHS